MNNMRIICSNKKDGNMSIKFSSKKSVIANREKIFEKNKLRKRIMLSIENKNKIVYITSKNFDNIVKADAVITKLKSTFIFLNFGDCIPLIIYDNKQKIVCFAHLGRISAEKNLHIKLINKFINEYRSNKNNIEVVLGPSIKKESYILNNPKVKDNYGWKDFVIPISDNNYMLDVNGYVKSGIKKFGITNVIESEIDTFKSKEFFSHYRSVNRNDQEGRFMYGVIIDK